MQLWYSCGRANARLLFLWSITKNERCYKYVLTLPSLELVPFGRFVRNLNSHRFLRLLGRAAWTRRLGSILGSILGSNRFVWYVSYPWGGRVHKRRQVLGTAAVFTVVIDFGGNEFTVHFSVKERKLILITDMTAPQSLAKHAKQNTPLERANQTW